MWRVIACVVISVLAACTSEDCDEPLEILAPSSGSGPGALRLGMLMSRTPYAMSQQPLAARSDGSVVCSTCSGIVVLDGDLREIGRTRLGGASIVVAPDDSTYAITPGADFRGAEVVALSALGEPRWTVPIAPRPFKIVAGTEGPYVGVLVPRTDGSVLPMGTIIELDAATGEPRTVTTGHVLLGASRLGALTVTTEIAPSLTVTVHQLDRAGIVVWSHALAAGSSTVQLGGALGTPDGGAIIFGSTPAMLDFGDHTLAVTRFPSSFVAGFDADGQTRWAFEIGALRIMSAALTAQGEILIATFQGGSYPGPEADAYLHVATPSGVMRTLTVDGPGNQFIHGVADASDGLAWLQVDTGRFDDNWPDPVMQIADRSFPVEGTYLLKLVY